MGNIVLNSFLPMLFSSGGLIELDLYFAFWFFVLFPPFWIISFPICWLINYIFVRKAAEKCYYTFDNRKKYNILAIKTTILCFVFDLCISIVLLTIYLYLTTYVHYLEGDLKIMTENFINCMAFYPLSNIGTMLIMIIVIFIVKLVQYLVYLHFIVKKLDIDEDKKKKFAFYTIICTIPYYYFLPTNWLTFK